MRAEPDERHRVRLALCHERDRVGDPAVVAEACGAGIRGRLDAASPKRTGNGGGRRGGTARAQPLDGGACVSLELRRRVGERGREDDGEDEEGVEHAEP